jgi:hypothetical protein
MTPLPQGCGPLIPRSGLPDGRVQLPSWPGATRSLSGGDRTDCLTPERKVGLQAGEDEVTGWR